MTDYFALLGQPRLPWLDPDKLKQAFHEKTLRAHPDARAEGIDIGSAEEAFAKINEAYQVLLDPRRRLHHLLCLEGREPSREGDNKVPEDIGGLFQIVAESLQKAERALQKNMAVSNPLSRALAHNEVLPAVRSVNTVLEKLFALRSAAEAELQKLSQTFHEPGNNRLRELSGLYLRFSYLTRWISQLEEKRTQLSG